MAKNRIKKYRPVKLRIEDEVIVISGKEKGKRGNVMYIDRLNDKIVVQGINRRTRFQRPTQDNPQGGKIEVEMPMHLSNVMFYDSKSKAGVRIGFNTKSDKKSRVGRRAGEVVEIKVKDKK